MVGGHVHTCNLALTCVRCAAPTDDAEWSQWMSEEGSKYNDNGEIMHKITLARKSTKLDLSKMGLCDPLPKEVYMIYYLKQLILEGNCLITVSPLIGNPYLNGLMQLSLSNNCLKEVPEEICLLVQMRFLYLDNNQLRRIPARIANMRQLTRFTLQMNNLEDLPTSMSRMKWIQVDHS